MTRVDPTELVLSIERELPVTEWRYRDVDLWPLLRQQIWLQAHHADDPAEPQSAMRRVSAVARDELRWARNRLLDHAGEERGRGGADVLLLTDGGVGRVQQSDGTWTHRLGDPLAEAFEAEGATVRLLDPHHRYRRPRARPSRTIQVHLDLLQLRARRGVRVELPEWGGLEPILSAADLTVPQVERTAAHADLTASWFERLLRRSGARTAVFLDWGPSSLAFALAARRTGVRSVEIQHGVHGRGHPHYGTWFALPSGGYSVHPDIYWTWQDDPVLVPDWAAPGQRSRVLVGGNPWVEKALALPTAPSSASSPVALLTLQPGLDTTQQLGGLIEAMRELDGQWSWWIRHHPTTGLEARERTQALLGPASTSLTWDEPSSRPLGELLPSVSVHVTVTSSTVDEARSFGIGSVLLGGSEAVELFGQVVAEGWAVSAETPSAIVAGLAQMSARRMQAGSATGRTGRAVAEILDLSRR